MIRRHKRTIRWAAIALLVAVIIAGFLTGQWFIVSEVRLPARLPTPVRIAVISDFHLGGGGFGEGPAQQAVREAVRQKPDVIVLLGDFVAGPAVIDRIPALFSSLHAPQGVFAVLGNHDHWAGANAVEKALADAGIRVLVNQNAIIRKGRTRLALVGIDDLWTGTVDWAAAWRGVPKRVPAVVLSHNPDAALASEGQRAVLILSGHTHAGKYWVPTFVHRAINHISKRGFISASRYGSAHPYGLVRERWGWIYITSGVSRGYFPPRWFTRPEVAVIELL